MAYLRYKPSFDTQIVIYIDKCRKGTSLQRVWQIEFLLASGTNGGLC